MRHPGTAARFEWDEGNLGKLAARSVRPEDVEAVFWNGPRWLRNKRAGSGDWVMQGRDDRGRPLLVVVLWSRKQEGTLRAISAREVRR